MELSNLHYKLPSLMVLEDIPVEAWGNYYNIDYQFLQSQPSLDLMNLADHNHIKIEKGAKLVYKCTKDGHYLTQNDIKSIEVWTKPGNIKFKNCSTDQKMEFFKRAAAGLKKCAKKKHRCRKNKEFFERA